VLKVSLLLRIYTIIGLVCGTFYNKFIHNMYFFNLTDERF